MLEEHGYRSNFWTVYMLGPCSGAVAAGLISWLHSVALRDHGPKCPEVKPAPDRRLKEDDEKGLMKDKKGTQQETI